MKTTNSKATKAKDSQNYIKKKQFFDQLLTIFGRKPILEALQEKGSKLYRLHLAESNKKAKILDDIIALAKKQGAEITYHDRKALSRISKNAKQDQGIAADLICAGYQNYQRFLEQQKQSSKPFELLALDVITNPQNLGMIIRSATAGHIDGILLPKQGCARLDALVIKASAGTLFKAPILRCDKLTDALKDCQNAGAKICGLSSHAKMTLGQYGNQNKEGSQTAQINTFTSNIFVLGNETDGVSKTVEALCDQWLSIPMNNEIESLNVAVTASLIAFRKII